MSEFIKVEWFGRDNQKVGIVLTYDQHDGFKARMAALPQAYPSNAYRATEEQDIKWLMKNAAKIPFEWAWGIFGDTMYRFWLERRPGIEHIIRYDHRDYDIETLKEFV